MPVDQSPHPQSTVPAHPIDRGGDRGAALVLLSPRQRDAALRSLLAHEDPIVAGAVARALERAAVEPAACRLHPEDLLHELVLEDAARRHGEDP